MPAASEPSGGALAGRAVIVTGGARGIGAAIAEHAAAAGAAIAVGYRSSRGSAEEVVERIQGQGGDAAAFAADVSDPGQAASLVDEATGRFGPIHGLVNSAAVMTTGGFLEVGLDDWS